MNQQPVQGTPHDAQTEAWKQAGITVTREGRIAIVRFDAGDKANALSHAVMRGLLEVARSFERDWKQGIDAIAATC